MANCIRPKERWSDWEVLHLVQVAEILFTLAVFCQSQRKAFLWMQPWFLKHVPVRSNILLWSQEFLWIGWLSFSCDFSCSVSWVWSKTQAKDQRWFLKHSHVWGCFQTSCFYQLKDNVAQLKAFLQQEKRRNCVRTQGHCKRQPLDSPQQFVNGVYSNFMVFALSGSTPCLAINSMRLPSRFG